MSRPKIFQFLFSIFFVLLGLNSVHGQAICPFDIILLLDVPDNSVGEIFGESYTNGSVASVTIPDPILSQLLVPSVEGTGANTQILISTIQPAFTNTLDVNKTNFVPPTEPGLQITLENGEVLSCLIILRIQDTNNQPPVFSRTNLTFSIPSNWDKSMPLNAKFEDALQSIDGDFGQANSQLTIVEGDVIRGEVKPRPAEESPDFLYINEVQLFLKDVVEGVHTVVGTDGVNTAEIQVEIEVIKQNLYDPVFTGTGYHYVFDVMPAVGDVIPVSITAVDPDTADETGISYSVAVNEYIEYSETTEAITFKSVDGLEGREVQFTIIATEENEDRRSSEVTLSLKFP